MKKIIFISALTINLVFTGCSWISDFGDTNTNPFTTNVPETGALLTGAEIDLGFVDYLSGYYCQYFSETFFPSDSYYSSNQSSVMSLYSGSLYDLQNIIITNTNDATKAAAEYYGTNENQIAIARILKAYNFWVITDYWGDLPYKEALKGKPNKVYDTQETIYKDLIEELKEAVAQFKTGTSEDPVFPIKGDIIYNGDTGKWKKLANSLRMLLALNLSKRYPGASEYSATEFKAAINDPAGSIESNSDNFQLNYPGTTAYRNPFYIAFLNGATGESEPLVSLLIDSLGNDQRQIVFGSDRNGNNSNLGVPYGRNRQFSDPWCQNNPNYCVILAKGFRSESSSFFIIKASSVLLARAEAADRGWTSENVPDLYQAGITASFTVWGLPAPDIAYFTKANVALGATGTNIKQIAIQQYLAAYPDGHLGWNTWRRTGYPVLLPAPDAVNNPKVIPRRIMYGTSDYSLTEEGVTQAVARLGANGDKMDSRVWWDIE